MARDFDWNMVQGQIESKKSFAELQHELKQIKEELGRFKPPDTWLAPQGTTWMSPTVQASTTTPPPPGWAFPLPQPLPPAHGHQTYAPPVAPVGHDPNYAINIIAPLSGQCFRPIKVLTPYGEFGVAWFEWEGLEVALERLAAEIRRVMSPNSP